MKNQLLLVLVFALCLLLASCGQEAKGTSEAPKSTLKDGTYTALFKTDSSMFHINEAYHDRAILTVKDGKMTIHITLPSKNTLNLFYGLAEDAQKDGAALIQPTNDLVTYDDGMTEEVFGFDVPVPYLDDEFDCALVGKKANWYDHKVTVSDPQPYVAEGEYTAEVTMTGGAGKATIESPATVISKNLQLYADVVWSSSHYEYMTVGDAQYDRLPGDGNSVIEIPITLNQDIPVSALTTAMSEPHLIDYVLHFDGSTLKAK